MTQRVVGFDAFEEVPIEIDVSEFDEASVTLPRCRATTQPHVTIGAHLVESRSRPMLWVGVALAAVALGTVVLTLS